MKKILLGILSLILITTLLILFIKKDNKIQNIGNNKNIKEIEKIMLNTDSYQAQVNVTITSNKNENTYKLEQQVTTDCAKQKVIEPETIRGMEIVYENRTLTISSTNLNISKVYSDYPYVSNNVLFLTTFFKKYNESSEKSIEEKDETIIMKIREKNNKYNSNQTLTIDKKTLKPKALEIKDENNKTRVYILYNEIEL